MKKIICVLLALLCALSMNAALADGWNREELEALRITETTITNRDKVIVRRDDGSVIGRLSCCAPVIVWETKDELSLISFPMSLMEIWTDTYTESNYRGTYSGMYSGWVKTECLEQSTLDIETLFYMSEECRYELWVDGIYHSLGKYGVRKNKNFDEKNIPMVGEKELKAHTNYLDLRHWEDWNWNSNPAYSRKIWIALYHCENAIDIAQRVADTPQEDTARILILLWQNILALDELGSDSALSFGERNRIVPLDRIGDLEAYAEAMLAAVQEEGSDLAGLRDLMIAKLKELRYTLASK